MDRRAFVAIVGGSMLTTPLAAEGQQSERLRRIGVLMGYAETDPDAQANVEAFREGLQKLRWVDAGQHTDRHSLADTRRPRVDATIRERTRRARARCSSFAHHAHHSRAAETDAHHPDRFRDGVRSGW